MNTSPRIIFFDGVCNFCNFWVDFIIKRDRQQRFQFTTLQGNTARELLPGYGTIHSGADSVLLLDNKKIYTHSSAALRICRYLPGAWPLLYGFLIVPKFLRDAIYRFVARNRYKWFGKRETCRIPGKEEMARFLD